MGIKYKVNEAFFEKWSPDMAYVLGYIYADGSLDNSYYIRARYIKISSVDRDSIERIRNWLDSKHTITIVKPPRGKDQFRLRIGSHKIYNDLIKLGLYPNKSLTVKFPAVPKKHIGHFIRGYFDGDGCIHFEKSTGKKGQSIIKRIRTIFTSGSKIFLDTMSIILKENGIEKGKIYSNQRAFQLKYPNDDSIRMFKLMYSNTSINSFFMRKFKTFKDYFELRPQVVDSSIRRILNYHTKGHVVK